MPASGCGTSIIIAEAQRRFTRPRAAIPTPLASWIRNLEGRAYLDDNKPATAARVLLANYQDNPRGERAADSLYYLGQSLTRLNRRPEACRVYDELAQVYPNVREQIRRLLPAARSDAHCGAAAAPAAPSDETPRRATPARRNDTARGGEW